MRKRITLEQLPAGVRERVAAELQAPGKAVQKARRGARGASHGVPTGKVPSALEEAFLWALKAYGTDLPAGEREHRFHPSRRWRFDWAWPCGQSAVGCRLSGGVAVELDGGQWMAGGGRHNTDRDKEKLNTAASMGWTVLRFSGAMLKDGAGCVQAVREALRRRGVNHGDTEGTERS